MAANDIYFPGLGAVKKVKPDSFTMINDSKSGKPLKILVTDLLNSYNESNEGEIPLEEQVNSPTYFVDLATTSPLTNAYTYDNGISGVGATITLNAKGRFQTVDGSNSYVGNIYLLKNELTKSYNGIYELTTVGDGSTQAVLTRIGTYDEIDEIYPSQVVVLNGSTNKDRTFFQKTEAPIIGISNIIYTELQGKRTSIIKDVILVDAITSSNLPYTYTAGTSPYLGVNAKLTKSGTLGGVFNGVNVFIGMKILVKNQGNPAHNGVYQVSRTSNPITLVRIELVSAVSIPKKVVIISNSESDDYGKIFVCDTLSIPNITIGTTPITFTEISGTGADTLSEVLALGDVMLNSQSIFSEDGFGELKMGHHLGGGEYESYLYRAHNGGNTSVALYTDNKNIIVRDSVFSYTDYLQIKSDTILNILAMGPTCDLNLAADDTLGYTQQLRFETPIKTVSLLNGSQQRLTFLEDGFLDPVVLANETGNITISVETDIFLTTSLGGLFVNTASNIEINGNGVSSNILVNGFRTEFTIADEMVFNSNSLEINNFNTVINATNATFIKNLPSCADEAAAILLGLLPNQLYRTPSGVIMSKL